MDNPEVRAGRWLVQRLKGPQPAILHFGASESMVVADDDDDKCTLPQMVQRGLAPGVQLVSTAGPTYHPRLIRSYLNVASVTTATQPRIVLVAIVIRSAQPPWALHPAYHYAQAITSLDRIGRRRPVALIRSVIALPSQSDMDRYDRIPFPTLLADQSIGDYRRPLRDAARLEGDPLQRMLYAYHHGGTTDPPAWWLDDITELAAAIRAMGATGVVYHPPVPLERGTELLGSQLRRLNEQTMQVAHEAFRAGDPSARFVRSALDHPKGDFVDPDDGTEHLNQWGRQRLARDILHEIRAVDDALVHSAGVLS